MFNQVLVSQDYRGLLRFVWWKNGDMLQEPMDFRMATYLFGAPSSPVYVRRALNYEEQYGSDAATSSDATFTSTMDSLLLLMPLQRFS